MKQHPKYKNYLICEDGSVYNSITKRYCTQKTNEFGYKTVTVRESLDSKWMWVRVHRLVAETYLPNPDSKREVNHIDCDKSNNNLSNLEWVTSKENKEHARSNGLYKMCGEDSYNATLTNQQVHNICQDIQDGLTNKSISEKYGIHKDRVSDIRIGRRWKEIGQHYNLHVKRNKRKSEATIRKICEDIVVGLTDKQIAELSGVDVRDVNRIRRGAIHLGISREYNFPVV